MAFIIQSFKLTAKCSDSQKEKPQRSVICSHCLYAASPSMSPHCLPAEPSYLCFAEAHLTGMRAVFIRRYKEMESLLILLLANLSCSYLTSKGTCLVSCSNLSAFGLKASLLQLFILKSLFMPAVFQTCLYTSQVTSKSFCN